MHNFLASNVFDNDLALSDTSVSADTMMAILGWVFIQDRGWMRILFKMGEYDWLSKR